MPVFTILLTNDDGIDAPGLAALERAFLARADVEVWVVAPNAERSACSHGMTLDRPIRVDQLASRRFSTSGLTADCVYFALFGCMPRRPDAVVSGINRGPNLGTDVIYSGTVAGAREAVIRGVDGIAASLVEGDDFELAAHSVVDMTLCLINTHDLAPRLLNLNYPARRFSGPMASPLGRRRYPLVVTRCAGSEAPHESYRLGGPAVTDMEIDGTDGWLVANGIASATFLRVDQTDCDESPPWIEAADPSRKETPR